MVLGLLSQYRVGGLWRASSLSDSAQFNLPATLAGWERVEGSEQVIGRPEILGTHSSIWNYRQGGRSVLVAFDYPFPGYHELATCYLASGWKITDASSKGRRDTGARTVSMLDCRWSGRPRRTRTLFTTVAMSRGVGSAPMRWGICVL